MFNFGNLDYTNGMIPEKIGRYEIKAELGRGGMATVYRAYDPSFDREVAVKVLPKEFMHDPMFRDRFKREVKVIAALEHPAIVPVYDVGEEDGVPYFVMRYMPGGSLTNQIELGVFSLQDASRIIEKLASALAYAHKKGVIHRDLKPDNILFDGNGDPYISDFGVASFSSATTDLTGNAAIGTPAYMSPEQAQGDKVDGRSDIYGLGVIIFQMLSGQQPYKADTPMGVAIKQINDPVPEILKVNPQLPDAADTVIRTAMAKKKEERYTSATELATALHQLTVPGGMVVPKEMYAASNSKSSGTRRKSSGARVFIAIFLLAAVGLGGFFLFGRLFPPIPPKVDMPAPVAGATEMAAPTMKSEMPTLAVSGDIFTEDFNGSLDSWKYLIAGGRDTQIKSNLGDGFLDITLTEKQLRYYNYYTVATYDNTRIDARVENLSDNPSIFIIICRYDENNGWYEFNINSGGLYSILRTTWDTGKSNVSSAVVANGGSREIHLGKAVNEYSATCNGRDLSLTINGTEVRFETDNQFLLTSGYVGFGVASEKFAPVNAKIDFISVNTP